MKPIWVKAHWNCPEHFLGECIEGTITELQVLQELDMEDGIFVATEYNRGENEFLTIGVRANKEVTRVYATGKFSYERELLHVNEGIWLSSPQYVWNERFQRYENVSPSIGLNQCGIIRFVGETKDEGKITTGDVKIRPSLLTEAEYVQMEEDILTITEELLFHTQINTGNTGEMRALIQLDSLQQAVKNIGDVVQQLEKNPGERLSTKRVKTDIDKLRKMDIRVLLEQELYPFKRTVNALTTVRSHDISEHRKLKGALIDCIESCMRQKKKEQNVRDSLERQLKEVEELSYKVLTSHEKNLHSKFISKKQWLCKQMEKLIPRDERWNKLITYLEDVLSSYLFQDCETEEWGDTHLFNFHPLYEEAFEGVEKLQKCLRQHEPLKVFQHDLLQSPDLYEKWVFFKVLQHFVMTLRFAPKQGAVLHNVLKYYEENGTLRGFCIRLYVTASCSIVIGSEVNIQGNFPDIGFAIEQDQKEIVYMFLDAKYKPYSRMQQQLERDLIQSAKRYRELMHPRGKAAFLVHADEILENNFEETRPHQYGYFLLKPGKEEGLSLFSKMMLHFHLGWERICPDCGNKEVSNPPTNHNYKKYYECTSCQSFWVQNICWNRNTHTIQGEKLYKYLHRNYHRPTQHDWDVYCPRCGVSFADRNRLGKW
ncbi:hypothetical protein [Bacillus mycoides]|uniref:hypothetical protein n=1 Tax=Bacillus mycoides TaxID=1405 RepID=UPI00119E22F1|nr:hypothetical protein [Bacillus mycoides]